MQRLLTPSAVISMLLVSGLTLRHKDNQTQKCCLQDNVSFMCLQFYLNTCLNILADNIYSYN